MWNYEKRLQYPVHITRTNPKAAQIIMSQYGGLYSIGGYKYPSCSVFLPSAPISLWFHDPV